MLESNLNEIKRKLRAADYAGAEKDLHILIADGSFSMMGQNREIPALWSFVHQISFTENLAAMTGGHGTACIDLRNGKLSLDPNFFLTKIRSFEDLFFILMHERDHRLLHRLYRIQWHRLRKIVGYNDEDFYAIKHVLEDAWINASVRSEMAYTADLPENFYCWSIDDEKDPEKSGFDKKKGHKVGQPRSPDTALLTCMSPFVHKDGLDVSHESLYAQATQLLAKYNPKSRYASYGGRILPYPDWYKLFCDWLDKNKDKMAQPSPDSKPDQDCPQHGQQSDGEGAGQDEGQGQGQGDQEREGSGEGDQDGESKENQSGKGKESEKRGNGKGSDGDQKHEHGQSDKPCTCKKGPMSLKDRLSRIPNFILSSDDLEEDLSKAPRKPVRPQVHSTDPGYGRNLEAVEVVAKSVQDLDDVDRELLEMGGSALTNSWKSNTVQIKGAIKLDADRVVQSIASLRVTEQKVMRPDVNLPNRPSRRDMMHMGLGGMPTLWSVPHYLEFQELVVYTDVSGSMNHWYGVALYLSKQLKEFGCDMYQFSNVVVGPMGEEDSNIFWTTGGTTFDAVAEHIMQNGFKAVVIITDNEGTLDPKYHEAMKGLGELYLICLSNHQKPRNYDPKTYKFCYGIRGWQGVTDKVTGIFLTPEDLQRMGGQSF